jgi:hypothetical protein
VQTSIGDTYLHAMESPEVTFTDYGRASLAGGQTRVALDPRFAETIEAGDYRVFLTAVGAPAVLTVRTQDASGFVVEGDADVSFTYEIVGTRKGFAGKRFGT